MRLMQTAKLAALTMILICSWPALAGADPFDAEAESFYASAVTYWGGSPTGCSTVVKEMVPQSVLVDHVGEATLTLSGKEPIPCFVHVLDDQRPPELCITIYHEVGHLEGYDHSLDPSNVMYPTPEIDSIELCKKLEQREILQEKIAEQRRWCAYNKREETPRRQRTICWRILREERLAWLHTFLT